MKLIFSYAELQEEIPLHMGYIKHMENTKNPPSTP